MVRTGILEAKNEGKLTLFDLTQLSALKRSNPLGKNEPLTAKHARRYPSSSNTSRA